MALTAAEILVCRELLAEHNARQVDSTLGTKTNRGEINRYWAGIPEPWHDAVLEFLANYVSASNYDVVNIANGDVACSIPGVLGNYVWNGELANGQPVRTNGTYYLIAVTYEEGSGQWRWAIVDNNNMILFLTALTESILPHWADDEAPFFDWFGFTDELGLLEVVSALPDLPEFEGQTLTMAAPADHLMVNEYGWVVTDTGATYDVTGEIVVTTVASQDAAYGTVINPLVDGHARTGTWSAGDVKMVETDGKKSTNAGRWTVVQTLWREPSNYLLVGRKITDRITEDTRLYTGVPEGEVSERVAELAVLSSYAVVEVNSRQTSRAGVYDVYVTVLTVNTGGSYILVGRKLDDEVEEITRKYPYVKETDVAALITSLSGTSGYAVVDVNARETKYDGVYDVFLTLIDVDTSGGYLVVGQKETNDYTEETRKYSYVVASSVSDTINSVTSLGAYSLVDSTARKTKWEGLYDIFLTVRTVKAASSDILVGSTGGLFKSRLYMRERVALASVASAVESLRTNPLSKDIQINQTRDPGWVDLFYSVLELPISTTTHEISYDMADGDYGVANWEYRLTYLQTYDRDGESDWVGPYQKACPVSFVNGAGTRMVTITTITTYSSVQPSSPSGSASSSGVHMRASHSVSGGRTYRLPNGLWVSESISISKSAWTNSLGTS